MGHNNDGYHIGAWDIMISNCIRLLLLYWDMGHYNDRYYISDIIMMSVIILGRVVLPRTVTLRGSYVQKYHFEKKVFY